jgi:hypothetical protein
VYLSEKTANKEANPDRRSRNVTDGLSKNSAAGQSTSSFFNTRKMVNANTLSLASQGTASTDPRIEKPMMLLSNSYTAGHSFFENLRDELLNNCANDKIRMLMPDY